MKIKILSKSDEMGGAFRAAHRHHQALQKQNLKSQMQVREKKTDDCTVDVALGALDAVSNILRRRISKKFNGLPRTSNTNFHSGNWLPSNWSQKLNSGDSDVINLHWVGGETLSIEDIGRITKPMVWTLHDMWPFCGAEHISDYDMNARWRNGYTPANRPSSATGYDFDRLVWRRKYKSWRRPMHIVAPSSWLAICASESELFRKWPITTIPNVLDTKVYQPLDQAFCRQALGLPQTKHLILFGAMGGSKNYNKGFDLLVEALQKLATQINPEEVLCLIFGQSEPPTSSRHPFPTKCLGHIHDDFTLALLYNAATVTVVPSRQENLPQTATESQACGCPVVAFNSSGLPDTIIHQETGYLAKAYDSHDLAEGIKWILGDNLIRQALGNKARERAIQLWSPEVVIPQYIKIYQQAIASHKN